MKSRGRGSKISVTITQFIVSLDIPKTVYEGAALQTTSVDVNVSRAGNFGFGGTVDWAITGAGTNPAVAADFGGSFPSGTLTFGANDAWLPINLTIHGNDAADGNRTFLVTLSNATTSGGSGLATIGTAAIICTILDDDTAAPTTFVSYSGNDVYYNGNPVTYGTP